MGLITEEEVRENLEWLECSLDAFVATVRFNSLSIDNGRPEEGTKYTIRLDSQGGPITLVLHTLDIHFDSTGPFDRARDSVEDALANTLNREVIGDCWEPSLDQVTEELVALADEIVGREVRELSHGMRFFHMQYEVGEA